MLTFWVYADDSSGRYVGAFLIESASAAAARAEFQKRHPALAIAWLRFCGR